MRLHSRFNLRVWLELEDPFLNSYHGCELESHMWLPPKVSMQLASLRMKDPREASIKAAVLLRPSSQSYVPFTSALFWFFFHTNQYWCSERELIQSVKSEGGNHWVPSWRLAVKEVKERELNRQLSWEFKSHSVSLQ